MTDPSSIQPARSYGCTFGCGNPYDFIVIAVTDGTTEFVCLPCYVRLAIDMVTAVASPEDPDVKVALAAVAGLGLVPAPGPSGKPGRKNAPATATDPSVIDEYDSVIDDLSESDI